jgi:prepilin-type N-terminal cleavage/methylation domain-containing protein
MKTQIKRSSHRGFTLVELLVVIAIIAILASVAFAVSVGALQRARMVKSLASATSVANGVEAFYADYNLLPGPESGAPDNDNGATPYETDAAEGIDLLNVLSGLEDDQNERKINYLGVAEATKGNRDGIVYNSSSGGIVGLYDSWGQPFFIVIDYNYDGRLNFNVSNIGAIALNNKNVAVYSLGTDTPSEAKRKDLVKTW